jgi:hypothetical protein
MVYVLNSGIIDSVSCAAVVTEHEDLSAYDFVIFFSKFYFTGMSRGNIA